MPSYTTTLAKNLSTNQPFVFQVSQKDLDYFERMKQGVRERVSMYLSSEEEAISCFEFSLFPAYKEVIKLSFGNGLTTELLTQILQEFGVVDPAYIGKLIEDSDFVASIEPWFTGICGEGLRASRTLGVVYEAISRFYTEKTNNLPLHPDQF